LAFTDGGVRFVHRLVFVHARRDGLVVRADPGRNDDEAIEEADAGEPLALHH